MINLINSVSEEPAFDFSKEEEAVAHLRQTKRMVDDQIQAALRNTGTFSDDLPGDPRYFNYEVESGIETQYGERVNRPDIAKFVGKGLRITAYNGFDSKRIMIPREIGGLPIISIGERAFMNTPAAEIILPKTLNIIMQSAFEGCKNLTHISLPNEMEILRRGCFSSSGLTDITIPDGIRIIPDRCFSLCHNLNNVSLGEDVQEIHSYAFEDCAITTLIIPSNVKKVAHDIFERNPFIPRPNIVCVFLGKETELIIPDHHTFNKVSLVYCLPGSHVQIIAREHNIPVKPLSAFRMEN